VQPYVVIAAVATVAIVVVLQGLGAYVLVRQRRAIERLNDRVFHLVAGLSLLTDTTEGGLRDIAVEIARTAASPAPAPRPARAATQRRIATAARRGRSVEQIAAAEKVSEGEVRLRLELSEAPAPRAKRSAAVAAAAAR
jgi:hypothetical protein